MSLQTAIASSTQVRAPAVSAARDGAIDSVRGLAILMVIGIHSLRQPFGSAETLTDAALRPAVPLFLFVSGYLTGLTGRVPLARRIGAALVPYTIAFAAAYAYMAVHNGAMDHRPWVTLARYGLGYVFVYYYIPIYIACTALLWLLFRLFNPHAGSRHLCIALAIAAGFGIVAGSYLDPLLLRNGVSEALIEETRLRDIPFWFAFMAIGTIAGLLRTEQMLGDILPMLAGPAAAAFLVYAAARIWNVGDAAPYDSPAFALYAVLLALLLLALKPDLPLLASIGSGSYFIYLWHIFVVMALRDHTSLGGATGLAAGLLTAAITAAVVLAMLFAIRQFLPPRAVRWLGA
jgi:peptidoglycan/LPS O-acetylase OafA/YrhL